MNVEGIYIKNHTGSPVVLVNGVSQTWTREGPEWKKRIKINWNGTVDNNGITINVR